MVVARELLQGVDALSTAQNISSRSCALIAAQALECALKTFLSYRGKNKEIRAFDTRHNLVALWDMAYKENSLSIPEEPPDWVRILNSGFYLRYQNGVGGSRVHGGQTPALVPMANELKKLIELVGFAVSS